MLTKGKNNFAGKVNRNRCTHTTVRTVRTEETRYYRKVSGFGLDRTSINNDDNNVRSLCQGPTQIRVGIPVSKPAVVLGVFLSKPFLWSSMDTSKTPSLRETTLF